MESTRKANSSGSGPQRRVFSVAELSAAIKLTLEDALPSVWVAGEISGLSRPASGHVYFTLKDDQAQIRGVMWRSAVQRLRFELENGQQVICQGNVEVYTPRGQYQLMVRRVEPAGLGALELALRQLRERLAAEGLFDPEKKKPLPAFPRRLAVVTSPSGAAIHDFLEVLRRRWPYVDVTVVPARVQGTGAGREIAAGIAAAHRLRPRPDVIVACRGGGSAEDLWCFNEEAVVRAIHAAQIPVVSAVGHEIDVTLSDLVADVRALTPSEAAERVAPDRRELVEFLSTQRRRLLTAARGRLARWRERIDRLAEARSLRRPLSPIHDLMRRVDELEQRLVRAVERQVGQRRDRLAALAGKLDTLSPLAVLGRGYSLTRLLPEGRLLTDAASAAEGDRVETRLARGKLVSRVEQVLEDER